MQHSYEASYKNIRLRPLQIEDIERLRIWRNDANKTKYLRQIGTITSDMQIKWFENYINDTSEIIFAIEEVKQLNRVVGSVALYEFNGECAEVGKIQIGDDEAHGCGLGKLSMVMAMLIGFRKLGFKRIVASVHRDNLAAYKSYMQIGFKIFGNHPASMGGVEDEIEMDEKSLEEVNPYISEIVLSE